MELILSIVPLTSSIEMFTIHAANSFIRHMLYWQCSVEEYERSWEQNEELGLNDMDTSAADAAYKSTDANLKEGTDG